MSKGTKEPKATQKPVATMTPLDDLGLGDIIHNVGIIAGTDWLSIVTAIDRHDDGSADVYEVNYPLLSKHTVRPKSVIAVVGHDDDAYRRACRMFGNEAAEAEG